MSTAGNRVTGFASLGIEGSGQFEPTEELDWLDRERLCPQEIITEDWDAKKGKDNGIETVNDNEDRLWSCTENGKLRWRTPSNERYIHIFFQELAKAKLKTSLKTNSSQNKKNLQKFDMVKLIDTKIPSKSIRGNKRYGNTTREWNKTNVEKC